MLLSHLFLFPAYNAFAAPLMFFYHCTIALLHLCPLIIVGYYCQTFVICHSTLLFPHFAFVPFYSSVTHEFGYSFHISVARSTFNHAILNFQGNILPFCCSTVTVSRFDFANAFFQNCHVTILHWHWRTESYIPFCICRSLALENVAVSLIQEILGCLCLFASGFFVCFLMFNAYFIMFMQ